MPLPTPRNGEDKLPSILYRTLPAETRVVDAAKRTATFVASTETPVRTPKGLEVLRIGGMDLSQFKRNPVVLDAHDRSSVKKILGSAEVHKEGRVLVADVRFATTEEGERALTLVNEGHLRANSIGFRPDSESIRVLNEGEADGDGESRVEGPAIVVNRSQLLELSLAPIPADENALRRSYYDRAAELAAQQRQKEAEPMAAEKTPDVKPATPATPPVVENENETRRRDILARAPGDMRALAEDLILQGKTVEQACAVMIAKRAEKAPPVGTPEEPPPKDTKTKTKDEGKERTRAISSLFGRKG